MLISKKIQPRIILLGQVLFLSWLIFSGTGRLAAQEEILNLGFSDPLGGLIAAAAETEGYFAEEKLTVRARPVPAEEISSLLEKGILAGGISNFQALNAAAPNSQLVFTAGLYSGFLEIIGLNPRPDKIRLVTEDPLSGPAAAAARHFREIKVDPDKIEWLKAPASDLVQTLLSGQASALARFEPAAADPAEPWAESLVPRNSSGRGNRRKPADFSRSSPQPPSGQEHRSGSSDSGPESPSGVQPPESGGHSGAEASGTGNLSGPQASSRGHQAGAEASGRERHAGAEASGHGHHAGTESSGPGKLSGSPAASPEGQSQPEASSPGRHSEPAAASAPGYKSIFQARAHLPKPPEGVKAVNPHAQHSAAHHFFESFVILDRRLVLKDPQKAAALTRALIRGARWIGENQEQAVQLGVREKIWPQETESLIGEIDRFMWMPGIRQAKEHLKIYIRQGLERGIFPAGTEEETVFKNIFVQILPDLS
jgi:ABC-type nitrate/sulfonate/bicarbonate transport system substrate-binding protein